jgi:mono/diheme cytochrome c family protein
MDLDLDEQMSIILSGRGAMPAFGLTLTDEQQQALESFLTSIAESTSPSTETGEQVYAENCAGCHGAELEGGIGPALAETTLSEADIAVIVGEGQGSMQGFADSLSSENLAAVVAYLVDTSTAAGDSPPAAISDAAVADLYAANCRTCHGANGEGGAGPPLLGTTLAEADLTVVIADGIGSMPGFAGSFSGGELEAMVEYVTSLSPGTEAATAPPTEADSGESIFLENCSECHGALGEGDTAPALAGSDLRANDIVVDVWSGHPDMPAFHEILSPDEILSVSTYVADLESVETAGTGDSETSNGWLIALVVAALAVVGVAMLALRRRARPAAEIQESGPPERL